MVFNFHPLGMDAWQASTPCIWPWPAIIAGAASLGSGIIGSVSQNKSNKDYLKGVRETNEANLQIQRETNQANLDLYREQVGNNRIDAAMQRMYDSPVSQVNRLRAAGINVNDAVSNGSGVSVASASPNPQVATRLSAPEQTPNPLSQLNLSDAVGSALSAERIQRDLHSVDIDLAYKGIEKVSALRSQLNQLRQQELDIAAKEILNKTDIETLEQLRLKGKYLERELDKSLSVMDETYNNLKKSGRNLDAQTEEIFKNSLREDNLNLAKIKSLDIDSAANYMNAVTNRSLSRVALKRLEYDVKNMFFEWKMASNENSRRAIETRIKQHYEDMDASEKRIFRALLWNQLQTSELKLESPFARGMMKMFGFNLNEIFHAGASLK